MRTTLALMVLLGLLGCQSRENYSTSSNEPTITLTNEWRDTSVNTTNRWRETTGEARPDNSKINVRDRGGDTLTPGDQGNSKADIALTQQIRKDLMADDSLSTTAKNIKIITVNGKVTLRGPVNSDQERAAIAEKARAVAGVADVDNQLEVKTQTNP